MSDVTITQLYTETNPETFQPLMTVKLSIVLSLENLQDATVGNNIAKVHESIGKSIVDAIRAHNKG